MTESIFKKTVPICIKTEPTFLIVVEGFANQMKLDGNTEATMVSQMRALRQLSKLANLKDPEDVKKVLATHETWNKLTRRRYAQIYNSLLHYAKITWVKPKIILEERLPFIPTELEIDQLIASCGKRTATLLQTLKETAIRISEAVKLKWIDLSTEQRTLNITPTKGSRPRILKIPEKLVTMLSQMPKDRQTIFQPDIDNLRNVFTQQRRLAAQKMQNPRLLKITFHTFRHWKATMEYHKTKDIIHVQTMLGHRNIKNTMVYINLEQALFTEESDEYYCKIVKTADEAAKLIETGFQYTLTTPDQLMLFRKRK
jgi:integrase